MTLQNQTGLLKLKLYCVFLNAFLLTYGEVWFITQAGCCAEELHQVRRFSLYEENVFPPSLQTAFIAGILNHP